MSEQQGDAPVAAVIETVAVVATEEGVAVAASATVVKDKDPQLATTEAPSLTEANDAIENNDSVTAAAAPTEEQQQPAAVAAAVDAAAAAPTDPAAPANNVTDSHSRAASEVKEEDVEMSEADQPEEHYSEEEGSEYAPEPESPPPKSARKSKTAATPKATATPKLPSAVPTAIAIPATAPAATAVAKATPRTPKTPINRVRTGRVDKSGTPGTPSTLQCPVEGCEQKFIGRNPRQSLWHHLKYYATRGLPEKAEFERKHGEAHAAMKREAEPKGTPVERNRISSSDYRKKNPEKAKTSARLSNFRARARKKGINDETEIEEWVQKWEKEWQEKQAKEASEYFSGILLSAFE